MIKTRLHSITILTRIRLTLGTYVNGVRRTLNKGNRLIITARVEIDLLRIEILPVTRHTQSKDWDTNIRRRGNRSCLAGIPLDALESVGEVLEVVVNTDGQRLQEAVNGGLDGAVVELGCKGADGRGDADGVHDLGAVGAALVQKGQACVVCARNRVSSAKNLLFIPT